MQFSPLLHVAADHTEMAGGATSRWWERPPRRSHLRAPPPVQRLPPSAVRHRCRSSGDQIFRTSLYAVPLLVERWQPSHERSRWVSAPSAPLRPPPPLARGEELAGPPLLIRIPRCAPFHPSCGGKGDGRQPSVHSGLLDNASQSTPLSRAPVSTALLIKGSFPCPRSDARVAKRCSKPGSSERIRGSARVRQAEAARRAVWFVARLVFCRCLR